MSLRKLSARLAALTGALALSLCAQASPAVSADAPAPRAATERWEDRPALDRHFRAAGVTGTIVVLHEPEGRWIASDSRRAHVGYLPASTFKIPNTLIALETGVAADEDHPWRWDGTRHWVENWNRDQTLASAYKVSAVWVYQDIARQVGAERMQQFVRDFRYGNGEAGPKHDRFWLDGALRISAVEQIDFLRRLNAGSLPLSPRTLKVAREVMVWEEKYGQRLFAKTGWTDAIPPGVGWFVGWVERKEGRTYFALNIDTPQGFSQTPVREPIARAVLGELGYLD